MLKNGPLCLAVYGGRDLAGLSSTDSHRPVGYVGEKGGSGIRETLLSLIRAVSRARPSLHPLLLLLFFLSSHPLPFHATRSIVATPS